MLSVLSNSFGLKAASRLNIPAIQRPANAENQALGCTSNMAGRRAAETSKRARRNIMQTETGDVIKYQNLK